MPRVYMDGGSGTLRLGKSIGNGAEGKVYEMRGKSTVAVKVYHANPSAIKHREEKVKAMIVAGFADVTDVVAFPQCSVYNNSGSFAGFTMRRAIGGAPIHEVYSRNSRLEHFPNFDYRMIVQTAQNVARAVGEVHSTGCLIGDINESGILVNKDATVFIVDADSFHVNSGGHYFPCRVGKPEYTPPELQGMEMHDVLRTPFHDYFGLAVLIFQLLFMGRHPYSGVPVVAKDACNWTLQRCIQGNQFAYSLNRKNELYMTAPPDTLLLVDFPASVSMSFEEAFGTFSLNRPSPSQWIDALDELLKSLTVCKSNTMHYYSDLSGKCVWCRLGNTVEMFPNGTISNTIDQFQANAPAESHAPQKLDEMTAISKGLGIDQILGKVKSNEMSSRSNNFDVDMILTKVNSFSVFDFFRNIYSSGVHNDGFTNYRYTLKCFWQCLSFIITSAICLLSIYNDRFDLVLIIFGIGVALFFWASHACRAGIMRDYTAAESHLDCRIAIMLKDSDISLALQMKLKILELAAEHKRVTSMQNEQFQVNEKNGYNTSLANFLSSKHIRDSSIPGLGEKKLMCLESSGVRTAFDIDKYELLRMYGIGDELSDRLCRWRDYHVEAFNVEHRNNSSGALDRGSDYDGEILALESNIWDTYKSFLRLCKDFGKIASLARSDGKLRTAYHKWHQSREALRSIGVKTPKYNGKYR